MGGTLLNVVTVTVGSLLGLFIGHRIPQRTQESVVVGLGLITVVVGLGNASETQNILVPLLSILIGVIIGEALGIDDALNGLAAWLQKRVGSSEPNADESAQGLSDRDRFITGFVTASLVFCVGPLTILGAIQDGMGLQAGFDQLALKSTLDAFASLAFAATFGIGVLFTTGTIFFVQGGLALLGALIGNFMTDAMIGEMVATGGIMLIGLALVILDLKPIRIANFLPALFIAPLIVAALTALNVSL